VNKMPDKKNIPEIRFKGFADEWEVFKLRDIADIIGGGTPSTSIFDYWDGNIDWYSPTEIGNKVFANGSVKKITLLGLEKSSAKILPANKTILFTSRAGIGDMAILKKDGATNQGFQSLVLKDGFNVYFTYSAGFLIKEYALKYASGSTFLEISGKQLEKMELTIPKSTEQSKIGNYFREVDKLIRLHQRKYDKLVNLKKAMLEKMFPQKGANVPEIRFKGFTQSWEEKTLGEILITYPFKQYISEPEKGGIFEIIQQGDNSVLGFGNGKPFKDFQDVVLWGDHTLSLYKPSMPFFIASDGVKIIGTADDFNGEYLHVLLENYKPASEGYKRHFNILKQVSAFITKDKKEQQKIGSYFQNFDKLISLHQKELEKLKNIKKACLEKMFV